jgi:hypothetical protein
VVSRADAQDREYLVFSVAMIGLIPIDSNFIKGRLVSGWAKHSSKAKSIVETP